MFLGSRARPVRRDDNLTVVCVDNVGSSTSVSQSVSQNCSGLPVNVTRHKPVPVFEYTLRCKDAWGTADKQMHEFLNFALDRGEWSASCPVPSEL
jgi:hypothetical protein